MSRRRRRRVELHHSLMWFSGRVCLPLEIILAARKMSLSPSELLATTSEPKQAYVCSAKTSHILREDRHALAHMCWIFGHACTAHRSVFVVSSYWFQLGFC